MLGLVMLVLFENQSLIYEISPTYLPRMNTTTPYLINTNLFLLILFLRTGCTQSTIVWRQGVWWTWDV
jgi:hypothetical protein